MPKSISYAFGEPIVQLTQLTGPPPQFFSDLDLARTTGSARRPLMDVDVPEAARHVSPAGFIFHLPRSGSTLVARMLTASTSCACIVEPEAINALLSSTNGSEALRVEWLRRLCQLYCAAFAGAYARVFVKLSSWTVLREPFFAEAFPGVRSCFVHREPAEVLVQLLRRPTGWMADQARSFILGDDVHVAAMSTGEYCARALGRMCDAALEGAPRVRALAYEQVPEIVPGLASAHFGMEVSDAERQAMLDIARYDSEDWSLQKPYAEGAEQLITGVTPEMAAFARRFAEPPRRRLLEQT